MTNTHPLPKLSAQNLPFPTDWREIFGTERPLILEIGFGYGQMLEYLHRTRPDHNIIGLEVNNFVLERMEKRIPRLGLAENVRVLQAWAETVLHHLLTPQSVTEVHINFPDPWFKARHAGRRLMQRDTLDAIVSRLTPDGRLYLATDIIAYAEMSAELLANTPGLTNQCDTPWASAFEDRVTTKYEKKARDEGRECYYFFYQRNDIPAPDVPVKKELSMPHLVIKTPLGLDEMLEKVQLDDKHNGEGEAHIHFMYRYHGERALLFEVFVHEPTIQQRVAIVIVERDQPDEYTIKLSALGNPRPTEGMHKAVSLLGDALLRLHPDAQIVYTKVRE